MGQFRVVPRFAISRARGQGGSGLVLEQSRAGEQRRESANAGQGAPRPHPATLEQGRAEQSRATIVKFFTAGSDGQVVANLRQSRGEQSNST